MISIIVHSTRESAFQDFEKNIQCSIGVPFEIIRIGSDSVLTTADAYNQGIPLAQYGFICFVQEQVYFYSPQWGKHLLEILKQNETGLVGVYGACSLSLFPKGWIDPEECQGQYVEGHHQAKPVQRAVRFSEHPLTKVVAVDSVFMATRKNILSGYSFPDIFQSGSQGLDIDLSLFIGQKYELVVTSDILLSRYSKNNFTQISPEISQLLYRKWQPALPVYSRSYTKQEIIKLKLKSLNHFQQHGFSVSKRLQNMISAARYAFDQGIFRSWFLNKVSGGKQTDSEKEFLPADESIPDKGFLETREKLNRYFNTHPRERDVYKKELDFINQLPATIPDEDRLLHTVIPYSFILNHNQSQTPVFRDPDNEMFYVYLGTHRLYYHRGYKTEEAVRKSFSYISIEQHPDSPHRYLDNAFKVNRKDVVADIGAAEGNFSLLVADIVQELIIVESDPVWMEALHKTFEPWKEKTTIIQKLIGGENDEYTITLDQLPSRNRITAIKMDVEGAELKVLHQARQFIKENEIKLAITLYHRQTDEADIEYLFKSSQYQTSLSNGYMLFIYDKLRPPYFRKGMIKAFHHANASL